MSRYNTLSMVGIFINMRARLCIDVHHRLAGLYLKEKQLALRVAARSPTLQDEKNSGRACGVAHIFSL